MVLFGCNQVLHLPTFNQSPGPGDMDEEHIIEQSDPSITVSYSGAYFGIETSAHLQDVAYLHLPQ